MHGLQQIIGRNEKAYKQFISLKEKQKRKSAISTATANREKLDAARTGKS